MTGKASCAMRVQRKVGVMGAPGLGGDAGGGPGDRHLLLVKLLEAPGLVRRGIDLEPAAGRVGHGGRGAG
ncbi:MAG: hypothetical protein KKG54_04685, partial [Alphaproteobacteria bacterium]|nr:hypothetical protein [Alphaproteobacteria bacterium]